MTLKLKAISPEAHFRAFRMGADTAMVVTLVEYRGDYRLDIRKYWQPKADEEFIPTRKGVNIPEALIPDLLAALVNVVGEFDEGLLDDIR